MATRGGAGEGQSQAKCDGTASRRHLGFLPVPAMIHYVRQGCNAASQSGGSRPWSAEGPIHRALGVSKWSRTASNRIA